MISAPFGKKQKPLFAIHGPVRVKVYRSNFKPFEVMRFLDLDKLKRVRKHSVEIGTLEAVGRSGTLVAEIRKGEITRLRLEGCASCQQKSKKRLGRAEKKAFLTIREKLLSIRDSKAKSPVTLPTTSTIARDIRIPIWPFPPIVVIIEPGTWCIAILVGAGALFCYYCPGVGGNCLL